EIASFTAHADEQLMATTVISPDGKSLARPSRDGAVKVWDISTANVRFTISAGSRFVPLCFSPDSKTLALQSQGDQVDATVQLWNAATGNRKHTFAGALTAISPDGKRLATQISRTRMKLWEIATGKELAVLTSPSEFRGAYMVFSPDGKTLAVAPCYHD